MLRGKKEFAACPGSSVGSEYLTTNQRVGGSSPSQDTISDTEILGKENQKGVDKQVGILYYCEGRRKAMRTTGRSSTEGLAGNLVLANGQQKKVLDKKGKAAIQ